MLSAMLQFRAPSRDLASYVRGVLFAAMEKFNAQFVSFALLRNIVITPSDATEWHCHFCSCVGVYAEPAALLRIRVPLSDLVLRIKKWYRSTRIEKGVGGRLALPLAPSSTRHRLSQQKI